MISQEGAKCSSRVDGGYAREESRYYLDRETFAGCWSLLETLFTPPLQNKKNGQGTGRLGANALAGY